MYNRQLFYSKEKVEILTLRYHYYLQHGMAWYHLISYNPYDRKEWYQNIKQLYTNKKYLYQFGIECKIKKET